MMSSWLDNMYGGSPSNSAGYSNPMINSSLYGTNPYSGSASSLASNPYGSNSSPFQPFSTPSPASGSATLASGFVNSAPSGSAMQNAATGWQNANATSQNLAGNSLQNAGPGFLDTLNQENSISYNPYLNSANMAGQEYGNLAGMAGQQANQYGNSAVLAGNQQQNLYNAGQSVYNTAFDPNMSQYNLTANNLTGQINAGQAARGLGNSPVGGAEYNNAMSTFNTGWNTQQLQNELSGIQGLSTASGAGANQGQLSNADLAAQLNAGSAQPGFTMQSGAVPTTAQQYVASMPGQNSANYVAGMSSLEQPYSSLMNNDLGYLGYGSGADLAGSQFNAGQTSSELGGLGSILGGITGSGSGLSGLGGAAGSLFSGIGDLFAGGGGGDAIGDAFAAFL